jgi:hypothetical protein
MSLLPPKNKDYPIILAFITQMSNSQKQPLLFLGSNGDFFSKVIKKHSQIFKGPSTNDVMQFYGMKGSEGIG